MDQSVSHALALDALGVSHKTIIGMYHGVNMGKLTNLWTTQHWKLSMDRGFSIAILL